MTELSGTLVIGLGNPLRGDDGIGVRVAQALSGEELPGCAEVAEGGTEGLGLVNLMEGRQRVILVDAAHIGKAPGEFVAFHLEDVHLPGDSRRFSVHAAGLRDALLLAEALDVLPEDVIIVGVQPAHLDWDSSLSPQVQEALPRIIKTVRSLLEAPARD